MPIKAFIGRPRQGKSYSVVKNVILPALKAKRTIVTNIPLKGKAYEEFAQYIIYQPEIDYKNIVNGSIYVIDEIWLDCPAGVTQAKLTDEMRHFLAMHAHTPNDKGLTTEIIVITQNLSQICTAITELIESTYYVEKIKLTDGKHKCRTYEFNGSVKGNPPKAKPVATKIDEYESEIFEYYKSHTGSKTDEGILEMDAIKPTTLLDKPVVKYGFIGSLFLAPLLFYYTYQSLNNLFKTEKTNTQQIQPNEKNNIQLQPNEPNSQNQKLLTTNNKKIQKIKESYSFIDEYSAFPLSTDMRITGTYNFRFKGYKKQGVHLTIKNQKTLNIPMQNVRIDAYGEYFLIYRNKIVTTTTGQPPENEYAYLPDGDSVPEDSTKQYFDMNNQLRGNIE